MAHSAASSSQSAIKVEKNATIIVLGMAGSGKSAFVKRLAAHLRGMKVSPYVVNLDPAVATLAHDVNIDIRDTVKYKEVMKEFGLGPNGAIMTCLNLMCTRFDQVVDLIKSRTDQCPYCLIDTPGQIEAFTWSASGSIITDSLASTFPTILAFVVDSVRVVNPTTFMSNMLYACSILYRTKLPFIVVFNKADIVRPDFAKKWMSDFETFQEALDEKSSSFMNDLTRSMSLVLDQFYQNLSTVTVSSLTGEGFDEFLISVDKGVKEYFDVYRPMYEKLRKEKDQDAVMDCSKEMQGLNFEDKLCELGSLVEIPPKTDKIHLGGVEEENEEDSMISR